jgi:hypothetical protein
MFLPLLLSAVVLAGISPTARPVAWDDLAALHPRFRAEGITEAAFPSLLARLTQDHARRVREGDLDHLVFYLLQSTSFTQLPPIEPALSAKALVGGLAADRREEFLADPAAALSRVPDDVGARAGALLRALDSAKPGARLVYFRELVDAALPSGGERRAALLREYLRVMRFVYEKEFIAQRSERPADAVAELYRSRGLSTDTAIEAGYLVYLGLGVLRSLETPRPVRRVLVVGPGLDLAPRTALRELGPPQSYQPWAVMDALLAHELSTADDLDIVAADINPRVVDHLRRARTAPPVLTLVSEIRDTDAVSLTREYREYFARLGGAIGDRMEAGLARGEVPEGHLQKTVRVGPAAARALRAERLDVVTERLTGPAFDVVIATNILPYFDDRELMLALSNIAAMIAPQGAFLHNESRPLLREVSAALGLPAEQSRHAVIASVRGAAPLFDSVWLHRKSVSPVVR